ncbi:hypothetical protein A605_13405 [Corynebacterium halotolerans YIM 70093 = DSM 44683]|uniref:NYN domain-containing protein n=2 Tax=Corynebacterium halotolerans TaxID=225326 RepID=M1NW23_9CORY|nr:hypothetical protein A605_13405 [Corynebacterium halotolerans YIM 70093 = DSM 44683]
MIQNQLHQPIHRQLWYDGIPDSGPHRYQRALRTCDGVQLRAGQLIEWGERRTQKAVDTRLVADMVVAAVQQQVCDFVLVSGDADMIPGVQEATGAGVRVHLYGFGWDSMSSALRHACDTTTILDPREDFADAMQLQVLEGPLPPVVRSRPLGDAEPPEEPGPTLVPDSAVHPTRPGSPGATPPTSEPARTNGTEPSGTSDSPAGGEAHVSEPALPAEPGLVSQPTTPDLASDAQAEPGADGNLPTSPTPSDVEEQVAREAPKPAAPKPSPKPSAPKPSMMAPRRKLRSRYVPLPEEVWSSAGFQTPFDVGQQYATWWYDNAATNDQRDQAHLLSGGGLPPEIDRPLLQFACETLHEYTLSEHQRVNLRDGFHSGIRGVLINIRREQ